MTKLKKQPVFPIVPSYNKDESLNLKDIENYVKFLNKNGVYNIMTTAGTSQFNFLSLDEIVEMNRVVFETNKEKQTNILGLPALGLRELEKAIKKMEDFKEANLLLLYPDRFYDNSTIVSYFNQARMMWNKDKNNTYLHGMPIRKGTGGTYVWNASMIENLFLKSNLAGMKEESPTFNESYNLVENFKTLKTRKDFELCVAGGDIRRFLLTEPVGATSFLVGAGSFAPKFDLNAYEQIKQGKIKENYLKVHNELYGVFTKIGWHKALRFAMSEKGFIQSYNRTPWPKLTKEEKTFIMACVNQVEKEINDE